MILALATAGAAMATPREPPPRVAGAPTAPPPAWFETRDRSAWLAFSSYCWTGSGGPAACVDFIPPARRPDIPRARVATGERLRLHLGFVPTRLAVSLVGTGGDGQTWRLPAGRVATWRVARLGLILVETRSPRGSASYAVRLVPRA